MVVIISSVVDLAPINDVLEQRLCGRYEAPLRRLISGRKAHSEGAGRRVVI